MKLFKDNKKPIITIHNTKNNLHIYPNTLALHAKKQGGYNPKANSG
jgi:hypothetical protein